MRQRMIGIMALVLVVSIWFSVPKAAAQSDPYRKMAAIDQYMMDRNAEIQLARSAAPDSVSRRDDPGSGTAGIRKSRGGQERVCLQGG